jgi:cytochrome c2
LSFKPDWLNPLLILVPDGKHPPFQERFLTANIRELKFVRLNDYYAPLERIAGSSVEAREGLEVFKNNCLFCHSLKGRGGNKGVRLLEVYGFSNDGDRKKFLTDFKKFHHKDNADKQDIEQFVNQEKLERIIDYLKNFGDQVF